ncbi:MAG: HEAT repeat domain-containing protein [Candidatus Poribacteria bacterium]
MRSKPPRRPTHTARLIDTPPSVSRVALSLTHNLGRQSYEEPFHVASTLRAYGVRVLSALGDHATEALRTLVYHLDPQVRVAVTEELVVHEDVASIDPIQHLALNDEDDAVQETAQLAVEELRRRLAERPEPEVELVEIVGEDVGEDVVVETGEDAPVGREILVPLIESGEDVAESGEDVASEIVVEVNDPEDDDAPDEVDNV